MLLFWFLILVSNILASISGVSFLPLRDSLIFNFVASDAFFPMRAILNLSFCSTDNFFDYVLGAYALGILLISNTSTKEDVIKKVAERISKLSPGIMKSVMAAIPQDRIYNKESYLFIKGILKWK